MYENAELHKKEDSHRITLNAHKPGYIAAQISALQLFRKDMKAADHVFLWWTQEMPPPGTHYK